MLGALIGAVGSVVGGALGSRPQKSKGKSKSTTTGTTTGWTRNRARLGDMVKAAEANGFNPLTILRAGGLAAFSSTRSKTDQVSNSLTKSKGSASNPAPLGAGIANAAMSIGGAIDSGPSQQAQGSADAWQGLRDPQNEELIGQQLGTQPRLPVSTTYVAKKPALAAAAGSDGTSMTPTYEQPTVTNPMPKGWDAKVNPEYPDAEAWETRYSDPGGWVGAAVNAWEDGKMNSSRIRAIDNFVRGAYDATEQFREQTNDKNQPFFNTLGGAISTKQVPMLNLTDKPVYMINPDPALGSNLGGW